MSTDRITQLNRRRRLGRVAGFTALFLLGLQVVTGYVGIRATLPIDLELTLLRGRLSVERPRLQHPPAFRVSTHRDGISLAPDGHWYDPGWWFVRIPLWMLAAPAAAAGAWAFWTARASRRWALEGRCPRCGYQLAGITSGRCPECGADSRAG